MNDRGGKSFRARLVVGARLAVLVLGALIGWVVGALIGPVIFENSITGPVLGIGLGFALAVTAVVHRITR